MDVYNVTDQHVEVLNRHKQTLIKAKQRQGQLPDDRRSREYAYTKFMLEHMVRATGKHMARASGKHMFHTSFVPPAYPPCMTSVAELQRVAIRHLRLETHHRGTYLLLRAITPPSRMTAIMVLVEDEEGDVAILALYQQEDEDTRMAASIVGAGTILLVKEPYYKILGDGEYGLRVDHLSDITRIGKDDERIPDAWQPRCIEIEHSAASLKNNGNVAMGEGRYWDAITDYSYALHQPATGKDVEIIKRNRALAYLKTQHFDAALLDTGFPNFNLDSPSEKALFRATEALYNLERFSECVEVLEKLRTYFPDNNQAVVVLNRAQTRVQEQRTGIYDFKQLQAKAKKLRPPHLDYATYIGPVEVRQTKSKGRGLFVTKTVKAGELLLCEKAFCHAYAMEGDKSSSKITLLLNLEMNSGSMGAHADLIKQIVQKLYRNPSIAPGFTTLFHGTYEETSSSTVDTDPIVDTFLVDRIISYNVFGCPVSSLLHHNESLAKKAKDSEDRAHHSCGIWTHASYINHNCLSTVRRAFIGNMMIVRATRDLTPGTELTFWYHPPCGLSKKDLEEKLQHWGFACDCAICMDAKETKATVINERRKLMNNINGILKSALPNAYPKKKIIRLLDALETTYTCPAPRLLLWEPQFTLALAYAAQNMMDKSLQWIHKGLASLGFIVVGADVSPTRFEVLKWGVVVDALIEAFLHVRTAFVALGALVDAGRADEYARTVYKMVIGEDASFDRTYG